MFCSILLRSGHLDINVLLHSIKVWTLDTKKTGEEDCDVC